MTTDAPAINVDPFLAHLMGGGQPAPAVVQPEPTAVVVQEEATVVLQANAHHTYLGKPDASWGWEELRDYIVDQIEKIHGPFVRVTGKEFGIVNGFISRWGAADAVAITRYAFETSGGYWVNAPITLTRFTKGNDPFFAQPIIERLRSSN